MFEAVINHPNLRLRSILEVLKVFEHLHMQSRGIWVHPYTVTSVQVGTKFWKIMGKVEPK
jgi:hypothetical protein